MYVCVRACVSCVRKTEISGCVYVCGCVGGGDMVYVCVCGGGGDVVYGVGVWEAVIWCMGVGV